jgi:hypothetical protein
VIGDPVGRQEVSRWETGKRTHREWLPFLAAALGVSVEVLELPQNPAEPPLPTLADFLPEGDPLSPLDPSQSIKPLGQVLRRIMNTKKRPSGHLAATVSTTIV